MADSIWKLLRKYRFNIDLTVNKDLVCIICRNVLINPYKSLCKCTYCLDCFKSYYSHGVEYCPGKSESCDRNILDVMEYLQFDKERSDKIVELVVDCPVKSCTFRTALKRMGEHLSSHESLMINGNEQIAVSNRKTSQFDHVYLSLLFSKFDDLQMKFDCFQNKFGGNLEIFNKEIEFLVDSITNNSRKIGSMKEIIVEKNNQIRQLEDQLKITIESQNSKIDMIKQNSNNYKIENEKLKRKLEMLSCKLSSFNYDFNNRKESVREIKQRIRNLNPTVEHELQQIYERLDLILCNQIEFEKKQKILEQNLSSVTQQKRNLTEMKENYDMNSNNLLINGISSEKENIKIRNDARSIWLQKKRKEIFSSQVNSLKNMKKVRQI